MSKLVSQFGKKRIGGIVSLAIFLVVGIGYLSVNFLHAAVSGRVEPTTQAVLAATTKVALVDNLFKVNFPTEFTNTVTFDKDTFLDKDITIQGKATFAQGIQTNGQNIVTGTGHVIAP